ncbi:uncharacterized protein LOC128865921 isoform X2 [Anastrepha ludens]|uniref:uncharacterized protein LOC128865921 isoform X2 n=1 Tax=Anastrepha ludens TaxID=28586 RepID=UPI0023AF8627|nr:uncharacterized protein LOC128865921 isoform X2 [Anastrepha ludens]
MLWATEVMELKEMPQLGYGEMLSQEKHQSLPHFPLKRYLSGSWTSHHLGKGGQQYKDKYFEDNSM